MARPPDMLKDQELLTLLRKNARAPVSEIAKALGVSRATVQARLSRLERDGAITGYTITEGLDAGAPQRLTAIVLIELDVRTQASVVAGLKRLPEVVSCHSLSGQYDLFAKLECASSPELDAAIDRIAEIEGVRRTTSSMLLARKFER